MSQSAAHEIDLRRLSELALENVRSANIALQGGLVKSNAESEKYPKYFAWKRNDFFTSGFKTEYQERFTDQSYPNEIILPRKSVVASKAPSSSSSSSSSIAVAPYALYDCDEDDDYDEAAPNSTSSSGSSTPSSGGVWRKSATGGWDLQEVHQLPVAGVKTVLSQKLSECISDWPSKNISASSEECLPTTNPTTIFKVPFAVDRKVNAEWLTEYDIRCLEVARANDQLKKDKSNGVSSVRPAGVPSRPAESAPINGHIDIDSYNSNFGGNILEDELKIAEIPPLFLQSESRESFGLKKLESIQEIKKKNYSHKYATSGSNINLGPLPPVAVPVPGVAGGALELSARTIADDWVMVSNQPVAAGVTNAVIPSEISVVVSSDNLEETSSIKFGKKQFPDKKSAQNAPECMEVTSNLKFGKKQFPTKRSADGAPIFDAHVQKSVAPKPMPCSETRLSFQEHDESPSGSAKSEGWEIIDSNALARGPSEAKNNGTVSANTLPAKPNSAVSSTLTCNGSSRSVKSSSLSAVAVAATSSSDCKSPAARKSAVPRRRKSSETVSQKIYRCSANPLFLYKRYNQPSDNQLSIYRSESQSKFAWKNK